MRRFSELPLWLIVLLLVGPLVILLVGYLKGLLKKHAYLSRHWPGNCAYCGYKVVDQRSPCPNCGKITDGSAAKPLHEWFFVSFDEVGVYLSAAPPGRESWSQSFRWDSIIRICFSAEDLLMSDGIYVFTKHRPESYVIPTEAKGGAELWVEILRRGLFDPALAIEAAQSTGGLYCWPVREAAG